MSNATSRTESIWMATAELPQPPPLTDDLSCDVCVIGAGIAGLTTAYLLAREGRRVLVLEKAKPGAGETHCTTAHLTYVIDDRLAVIERLHGLKRLREHVESHQAAIAKVAEIVAQEGIDCDLSPLDGYLFAAAADENQTIAEELEAALRCGLPVESLARLPLPFATGRVLRFAGNAQFHPLQYLAGLLRALERDGAQVFGLTEVVEVEDGERVRVKMKSGNTVTAAAAVVATNAPFTDRVVIHNKQAAYRTYAIAARVPAGSVPLALYWDTEDPYHYVRLQRAGHHDVLIVGGEDHKTGQGEPETAFTRLAQWMRERFPQAGEVEYRWSGQVLEPVDGMAYIGRDPLQKNVYVVTGDSGMGMTHGTIAGILLTDLIQGRANPWAELYDPARKTLGAAAEYARENLNVVAQYGDWFTGGEVESVEQIPEGEGALMRDGIRKLAVYRDAQGGLHARSAVCTHLGCAVQWNHTEKSWDCPCHGSRFDGYGRILNGPAKTELAPAEIPGEAKKPAA